MHVACMAPSSQKLSLLLQPCGYRGNYSDDGAVLATIMVLTLTITAAFLLTATAAEEITARKGVEGGIAVYFP